MIHTQEQKTVNRNYLCGSQMQTINQKDRSHKKEANRNYTVENYNNLNKKSH